MFVSLTLLLCALTADVYISDGSSPTYRWTTDSNASLLHTYFCTVL